MKHRQVNYLGVLLGVMILACISTFARTGSTDANHSLILFNDRPMEYTSFTIGSRGKVALMATSSEAPGSRLSFRIYLKRGNTIISGRTFDQHRVVTEVEISNVLAAAKHGDDLIVEPVNQTDSPVQHVIKVVDYIPMSNLNLLLSPKYPGNGC